MWQHTRRHALPCGCGRHRTNDELRSWLRGHARCHIARALISHQRVLRKNLLRQRSLMNCSRMPSSYAPIPPRLGGCTGCHLREECGGLDGQANLFGCFDQCATSGNCKDDWVCFCRPKEWVARWREVGGLPTLRAQLPRLHASNLHLPLYVPVLQHGSSRSRAFFSQTVALPTFNILGFSRKQNYGPKVTDERELRARFKLHHDTQIILLSVAKDNLIEDYWSARNRSARTPTQVAAALANLGVSAITVPNFSFFSDAPRSHLLWNRARMERCAEEFSTAGLSIIPHLNALTRADWDYWASFLTEQPSITAVTKEFQTGQRNRQLGEPALYSLAELQQRVGRPLHPILVGGAQYTELAAKLFTSFTISDSTPFEKAAHRQRLILPKNGRPMWRRNPLPPGTPIDHLLRHNIDDYAFVLRRRAHTSLFPPQTARQIELPLTLER
ncbi:uncharacterized protein STAUR_2437 [Stigmatella aurantiaca DW4/3-1]|uniref:DUF4417 domain-containing protein n=1 Tax=Stigmatella aurantiaca (strain DW4/3-1) TaxID=378806 RepID=Q08YH3_STIAD|nr:uncharacterized protein STAUR_2437 [Stigmatella aurantiaca DW4/3-1]EAU65531.1 hypothetical protein STIAU_1340 [Stigmatella aurantiaca DW4/3-1]